MTTTAGTTGTTGWERKVMFTNVEDAMAKVDAMAANYGDIDEWEYADLVEAVAEDSSPTVAAELRKRFFYPDITVRLVGEDGNAFIIIGRVRAALRKNGCSSSEVAAFTDEAMSSDYDNVLQTVLRWVNAEYKTAWYVAKFSTDGVPEFIADYGIYVAELQTGQNSVVRVYVKN